MIQYSSYLSQWLAVNPSYDREWFDNKEAAEAFAATGWQEPYRGFIITRDGRIWQHDAEVFGYITTRSYSVEEAKDRIDLSILARGIAATHPDPVGFARGRCELESGSRQREGNDKWVCDQAENQLHEHD